MAFTSYVLLFTLAGIVTAQQSLVSHKRDQFEVIYEWNYINFTWPSSEVLEKAVATGNYIEDHVIITGIKQHGNRLFLAMPRLKNAVPATLGYIPLTPLGNDTSPDVTPYPSLSMNKVGNCESFQSVQSFEIDLVGTMWVIDTGRTSTMHPDNQTQTCPPSLTLVDLVDEKKPLSRYTFHKSVANENSYLSDIVLDDSGEGFAYITDSGSDPGIIVYSKKENHAWKVKDPLTMQAEEGAQHFSVNGTRVNLEVNIDGIALGPRYMNSTGGVDRNVYYSPLSSFRMHYIQASVLQANPDAEKTKSIVKTLGFKPSQTAGMIMDEEGFLYYGLIANCSIVQWNSLLPFATQQHILAEDPKFIQWPDRFSIDDNGNIYVVINRRQKFAKSSFDTKKVNLRILKSNIGNKSYLHGPTSEEILELNNKRREDKKTATSTSASSQSISSSFSILAAVLFVLFSY